MRLVRKIGNMMRHDRAREHGSQDRALVDCIALLARVKIIARRKIFSEDRGREEVCPVRPVQSYPQESIKEELNTAANVTPSPATNTKGTGKGAPQSKAKPPILPQDGENAKSQVKYLDEYFVNRGKTHSFWLK